MKKILIIFLFLNYYTLNADTSYNLLLNLFDGIGLESQSHKFYKIGGYINIPHNQHIFPEKSKTDVLISTFNDIAGFRYYGPTKYKTPDFLIYLNTYPWEEYNLFISFIYKYESSFKKEISSIPLYSKEDYGYIEFVDPLPYRRLNYISYDIVYNSVNKIGIGIGYEYLFNKKLFFKIDLGIFPFAKKIYPSKIIYFPDLKKILFYSNVQYTLEQLILEERNLKETLEKNDNINFYRYGLFQFSIGYKF